METQEGLILRRHVDHIRRNYSEDDGNSTVTLNTQLPTTDDEWVLPDGFANNLETPKISNAQTPPTSQAPICRSNRLHPPVDRYSPSRYT